MCRLPKKGLYGSVFMHTSHLDIYSVCSFQVERCYYYLNAFVETAQKKEPVEGRLVQFLLSNPTNDGGQWDMLVNIIGKGIGCWKHFLNCPLVWEIRSENTILDWFCSI